MTAEIGSLGVLLEANTAGFEASMAKAAAAAEREMARTERANKKAAIEADRFVASIQRQIDTFGLSGTALQRYEAGLKGAADKAGPLLDRLDQLRAAQAAGAAASDASATAGARFVASLNEQVSTFGKSASELLAMKAAQLGVSESAAGLIGQLDRLQAAEREAAAASQAAVRSAAEQVAGQRAQAAAQQAFIDGLQREAEAVGKSRAELLALKAAQLGVGDSAAPLIAQMERLQAAERAKTAAQQASARAAQEAAAAERAAAQTRQTFLDSLQREADAIGKTRTELLALRAAELGVGEAAQANIAKINAATGALNRYGVSAGQTRAAFGLLPAQITDIVTQLAGGQNPFLILIQQGGQIKDSFGGIGPTLAALGTFITPVTVAVGALAAGAAALAYAFGSGSEESAKLGRALQATGGFAGFTAGQIEGMAHTIADSTQTTIGSTRDVLQALAASGRFSGETFTTAATAVQQFAKATGQSTDSVVQKFVSMADNVGSGVETLNRQVNSLTAAQVDQIKTLDEQGQHQEALRVALAGLSDGVKDASQNLGTFARAWATVGRVASEAIDAMKEIGRVKTPEMAVANIEAQIAALEGRKSENPAATAARREQLEGARQRLTIERDLGQLGAEFRAQEAQRQQAAVQWDKVREANLTRQEKLEKEIARLKGVGAAAGAPQSEIDAAIADARERFKPPKGPKGPNLANQQNTIDKADLSAEIAAIKAQLDARNAAYRQADTILGAQRSAGLLSEKEYYDAKRALIELGSDAEIRAIDAERKRLGEQTFGGTTAAKDRIDNERKIADLVAKRARVEADAGAALQVLGIQQTSAQAALVKGYQDARNAAQDYLDTLKRTQDRTVDAFGQGDKERARIAARQQIEDKYDQQRRQLENNRRTAELTSPTGALNADAQAKYDQELALLKEYLPKALAEWDDYYARVTRAERDWTNGASRALANYGDQAANTAAYAERFTTGSLGHLEDAVAKFSRTGKLNLGSLWQFMADEFLRQQARMLVASATGQGGWLSSVFSAVGSYFGVSGTAQSGGYAGSGLTGDFARLDRSQALGGAWDRGAQFFARGDVFSRPTAFAYGASQLGVMGEAGPEAVMPLKRGADGKLGVAAPAMRGGDTYIVVENHSSAEVKTQESRRPDGSKEIRFLIEAVKGEMTRDVRGGGDFSAALQGTYGLNRAAGVMRGG